MRVSELDFNYPEELVAVSPARPSRVMSVRGGDAPVEITLQELLNQIQAGDILVLNNTKVLKRRVFVGDLEVLFLKNSQAQEWEVLFPSRKFKVGDTFEMPLGVIMTLKQKGRPQLVELSRDVGEDYFRQVGELPLPPYIQKARQERHTNEMDDSWYQTAWAQKEGSFAAPTASLHFSSDDIATLQKRGVHIVYVTLHVGLGTFLPITAEDLDQHEMHSEFAEIPMSAWQQIQDTKNQGGKVWALGTTAVRTLESAASGLLRQGVDSYYGETKLLIQPGYEWKVIDVLLTNFHQPQSTLLALVAAFSDLASVKNAYQWAIERKFKLFSYGDLSVWRKS